MNKKYGRDEMKALTHVEVSSSDKSFPCFLFFFIFFCIFCMGLTAALPQDADASFDFDYASGLASGSNVSSVTSGDGCIFVSPTTGNVIITFNTSCGTGTVTGSGKNTNGFYLYNDTNTIYFNESTLNQTIESLGISLGFNTSGGNSSFNQALTDTLYADIQWNYNQTVLYTNGSYLNLTGNTFALSPDATKWLYNMTDGYLSEFDYNQTIPANAYTDSVNASTASWIESTFLKIADMFSKIDIVNMIAGNRTEIELDIAANYTALDNLKLNKTDQRYNDTALINSINTSLQTEITERIGNDSLKANLAGGNSFTGVQTFDGDWGDGGVRIDNGDLYAQNLFVQNITALNVSEMNTNGSFIPQINNTFDLGSDEKRWGNGYFGIDIFISGVGSIKQWLYNQTQPAQDYADTQDLIFNTSIANYVDAQNILFNDSMRDYVLQVNSTAGDYTLLVNSTAGDYALLLNVSAGQYADLLNISAGEYTDLVNISAGEYTLLVNTTAGEYALLVNITAGEYTDAQDLFFNSSITNYVNDNFIQFANQSDLNVNSSVWWAGILSWRPGWFTSNGTTLDFNETKLNKTIDFRSLNDSEADLAYLRLDTTNSPLQGNLNVGQHNITNIGQLQAPDGSVIKLGDGNVFSGIDQAIHLQSNQTLGPGVITHVLTDNQGQKVIEAWQSGKNNSAGFHRNSYLIFGDQGIANASILTDARVMWNIMNISSSMDYDTSNQGAALGVQYGIETQKLFLHDDLGNGQLLGAGEFRWISDGGDIDLYEGAVHILDVENRIVGKTEGQNVTTLFAPFTNRLSPFNLITTGKGIDEWADAGNGNCPSGGTSPCGHAGPSGGTGNTIMEANISTLNLGLKNLTFDISTTGMNVAGNLTVIMNNNIGSGDVLIYELEGSNLVNSVVNVSIPATMDNQSAISMDFKFSSANPNLGNVWVDDIAIDATVLSDAQINGTFADGKLEFGDGTCQITVNGTDNSMTFGGAGCGELIFQGNITFESVTESELNVTGTLNVGEIISVGNITSTEGWFNGLFNWFVDSDWASYFTFNGTTLDVTDFANDSWSSTYNATYSGAINNESYLSTFNSTYAGSINNKSYLSTFNSTYDDYKSNVSINYTQNTFNQYNSTWDNSFMNIWNYNQTLGANYTSQTFNTYNSTWDNRGLIQSEWFYNQTYDGSTFNATYDIWAYNQSSVGGATSWSFGADTIYNDTDGVKVGIGTNNPVALLDIVSTSATADDGIMIDYQNDNTVNFLDFRTLGNRSLQFSTASGNGLLYGYNQGTIGFTFSAGSSSSINHSLGLGDATPDGKFEVRQIMAEDILNLYDDATNVFTVLDGGNIGAGLSDPDVELEIGDITSPALRLRETGSSDNYLEIESTATIANFNWGNSGGETFGDILNIRNDGKALYSGSEICTAGNGLCAVGGGNLSWNQSYANTLYEPLGGGGGGVWESNGNIIQNLTADLNLNNTLYYNSSTGRLGLGTATPETILNFYDNSATGHFFKMEQDGNGLLGIIIQADGTGDSVINFRSPTNQFSMGIDNSDSDKFKITGQNFLAGSYLMTLEQGGNAGFGTTTPQAPLHVVGTLGTIFVQDQQGDNLRKLARWGIEHYDEDEKYFSAFVFDANINTNQMTIGGGSSLSTAPTKIRLFTAPNNTMPTGIEAMAIDGSQNIGAGTTSPAVRFHIKDTIDGDIFRLEDSDGTCDQNPEAGSLITTCSSDFNIKFNETISNVTSFFERARGVILRDYNVISSGDRLKGVFAQEFMQVFPEKVSYRNNSRWENHETFEIIQREVIKEVYDEELNQTINVTIFEDYEETILTPYYVVDEGYMVTEFTSWELFGMVLESYDFAKRKFLSLKVDVDDNKAKIDNLESENQMLKDELCEKDNTYSWCLGVGIK